MIIQKIYNFQNNYNYPKLQEKEKKQTSYNNSYTSIPYYNDINFQARVDKGLVRFYDVNKGRMPKTVKRFIDKLASKDGLTPLQAQTAAFAGLIGVTTVAGIKAKFPDEDLFQDLTETSQTKANRGILGVYRQNKELLETCDQDILASKENFTVWLVKKIFMDGKTLDEINKDLDREINPEFKELYVSKEPEGQYVRSSTLKALGIKTPEAEYMQSLRYTKDGYADMVGEKITQGLNAFWDSLSPEQRNERAKKTVLKFIKWWDSIPQDEKLEMIVNQTDEIELLKRFNEAKLEKSEKYKRNNPPKTDKKVETTTKREHIKTELSHDDELFKAWAKNNFIIFETSLSEEDKKALQIKREQKRAEHWASMTAEEKTEYISKMKSGAEPLRFAMIDAWNSNPDILIKLSIFLKKKQVERPEDIIYRSTEYNQFQSQIMSEFWSTNPEYADKIGEAIKDSHYKVKEAIKNNTFESLKESILKSRTERTNLIKNKVKNHKEILSSDEYKMYPDYMKEFIDLFSETANDLIRLLPSEYMKDFFKAINETISKPVIESWKKSILDQPMTDEDIKNIEIIKITEPFDVALMNRAIEAAMANALFQCTGSHFVYLMPQNEAKFALAEIASGKNEINILPEEHGENFKLKVINNNIDIDQIAKDYKSYKELPDDLFRYVDSYFLVNNSNIKTISSQTAKDVYSYISTYGKTIDIIFGQPNKYPIEVRKALLSKLIVTAPKELVDLLAGCTVKTTEDFEKEDLLGTINSELAKKYSFLPKDALKLYTEGLNIILRSGTKDMLERYINLLKSPTNDPFIQPKLYTVDRNVYLESTRLCILATEQALADVLYQATGEEKVYSLMLEELTDLLYKLGPIVRPKGQTEHVKSAITGEVFTVKLKNKVNFNKLEKRIDEYLKKSLDMYSADFSEDKDVDKEELLYTLNPYEENSSLDKYIIARINNSIK